MISNVKDRLNNFFSIWPKTVFVVTLILLCSSVTVFGMKNEIKVVVDGEAIEITTLSKKVNKIFENNGITVTEKDKVSVALDSVVKDGDVIYINKAINVDLNVDGATLAIASAENTIKDMLNAEGIEISADDKIVPPVDTVLSSGMKIEVTRVNKQVVDQVQQIAYQTEVRKNSDMTQGKEKVVQEGVPGEKLITTEVVYENGTEVSRRVLSEKIQKAPVKKIVDIGTLGVVRASRGGEFSYSEKITLTSTAYTADRGDAGSHTATGTKCRRDVNGYSTVAVDPRVIPLGTKLYIEGYGLAIAEDTGGAIKGKKIDVYLNTYEEMINWGRKQVNVYILK